MPFSGERAAKRIQALARPVQFGHRAELQGLKVEFGDQASRKSHGGRGFQQGGHDFLSTPGACQAQNCGGGGTFLTLTVHRFLDLGAHSDWKANSLVMPGNGPKCSTSRLIKQCYDIWRPDSPGRGRCWDSGNSGGRSSQGRNHRGPQRFL